MHVGPVVFFTAFCWQMVGHAACVQCQWSYVYLIFCHLLVGSVLSVLDQGVCCRTALAEAEIEYNDSYCSPSVYVRYRLQQLSGALINLGNVICFDVLTLYVLMSFLRGCRYLGASMANWLRHWMCMWPASIQFTLWPVWVVWCNKLFRCLRKL